MAVTGKQVAEKVLTAFSRKGGYIWGQSGAEWTASKQAALERKYNQNPEAYADYKGSAKYGKKWIGHPVWDCSGLCRWALKQFGISVAHGSNSIWDRYLSKKGKLTSGMALPEGAPVFTGTDSKKPHIGIYTGDGMVTEASGANAGVIRTKLHGGKWKYWGLYKNVSYDFIPGEQPASVSAPVSAPVESPPVQAVPPTLRKGAKGENVRRMQAVLVAAGFDLPKYGVDGSFGRETLAALKAYQKSRGLKVDGICGPKTWAAIGGEKV